MQLTPPGSPCSIHLGTPHRPCRGSAQGLFLVVDDIETARADLITKGVDVSEHSTSTAPRDQAVPGPDPEATLLPLLGLVQRSRRQRWLLQEITTRLPGRGFSLDLATLTDLLHETETRHGEPNRRSEAPLVGMVRGLYRRAGTGQDPRGSSQGCRAPHRGCSPLRGDIVPGANSTPDSDQLYTRLQVGEGVASKTESEPRRGSDGERELPRTLNAAPETSNESRASNGASP